MKRKALLLSVSGLFALCVAAHAQRLSQNVLPELYTLRLEPDIKAASFHGEESIDVTVAQPTTSITLNAIEIKFGKVVISGDGQSQDAAVSLNAKDEQATLSVAHTIPAGKAVIKISYDGILNNELRGFYLSKTPKRNYAVTQFEPTDARRAYPSFDEPAMKARFKVTLVVDKGDTAISNTNVVSDTPGPGNDKHTVTFAQTPRMSTYLVAFLVGDFQCLSGSSDGVPIRACATPDKVQLGRFALTGAEYFLHYYDNYFGIKYPMPKLDMIAIPDFEAGAMENFGAITYREEAMLLNEKTASEAQEKNVAIDVAHEMAHQWFGDMVTMQWWNNIWLNEGFATWMEDKAVEVWKPEWNIPQDQAEDLNTALDYDSRLPTRAIRSKADTPDEINQQFDEISYDKAGAILGMVEHYLGEETFRKGVHNYLAAHIYANATAEDFWNAQTATSKKPVDKIMDSFVGEPGVPLLDFSGSSAGKVQVSQQRFFFASPNNPSADQTWTIPVCFKAKTGDRCDVLGAEATQSATAPPGPFLFANAGAKGYYRTVYSSDDYKKIVSNAETELTAPERIYMLGNQWALMRSGRGNVGEYLDLVQALSRDTSSGVIRDALQSVGSIRDRIAETPEERAQLRAWVRKTFRPLYDEVKVPSSSDTDDRKLLRASLFGALGSAKDPEVIAEAKTLANKYLDDPTSVDPNLGQAATAVAAMNGDAAFYDKLLGLSKTATDPALSTRSLYLLAYFQNPALAQRLLNYAVSGQVRNQDAWILLLLELRGRENRDAAWDFMRQNWDKVQAQLTTSSGGYLVGATGAFCSAERRDQVTTFFAEHKVAASDRALKRAVDQINDCVALRQAQEPDLKSWLAKHSQ